MELLKLLAGQPSRADRLGKVVVALEDEFADILEELTEEIRAELEDTDPESLAGMELEETLEEIAQGESAMHDAWEFLYWINMRFYLDEPGKALAERGERPC